MGIIRSMRPLILSLIIMALSATFGIGWVIDLAYEKYISEEHTQLSSKFDVFQKLGRQLSTTLDNVDNKQAFIDNWQSTQSNDSPYSLTLLDMNTRVLPAVLLTQLKNNESVVLESSQHISFHFYLKQSNKILILKAPTQQVDGTDDDVNYMFTLLFYFSFTLLLLVWLYPLTIRLIKLGKTAQLFGKGDLTQRVMPSKTSYIGQIEREFNNMAQQIEDLVFDVKLLSSAVSHDLRTPLARLQFGIDTLSEEDDPVLRKQYENRLNDDLAEMQSLVERLLQYARLDQHQLGAQKHTINLSELVKHCAAQLTRTHQQNVHADKSLEQTAFDLSLDLPAHDIFINGDEKYLQMLLNNLLNNALLYGLGKVNIGLSEGLHDIKLTVDDNGLGIDDTLKQQVFKPFIRGKHAQQKGHGFGLAIVKRIAEMHHAKVEVLPSAKLGGAQFTISFPAKPNPLLL